MKASRENYTDEIAYEKDPNYFLTCQLGGFKLPVIKQSKQAFQISVNHLTNQFLFTTFV